MRVLQRALSVMVGGESHPASGEDGGGRDPGREDDDGCSLQWREGERRDEGEEAAEKEMVEEGEKWTRCFPSERVRPKEGSESSEVVRVKEEVEARSCQPGTDEVRRHER